MFEDVKGTFDDTQFLDLDWDVVKREHAREKGAIAENILRDVGALPLLRLEEVSDNGHQQVKFYQPTLSATVCSMKPARCATKDRSNLILVTGLAKAGTSVRALPLMPCAQPTTS